MPPGRFIICFDYELAWGRFDKVFDERYLAQVRLTRTKSVPSLLEILDRHHLPATWAVVGHLMLHECDGVHAHLDPYRPPHFPDWFSRDCGGVDDGNSVWMARDTIERIVSCRTPQELASHSFSHVDFAMTELTRERARQELELTRQQIAGFGQKMVSHVFPRGRSGHLDVLKELGVQVYRIAYREQSPRRARFAPKLKQFVAEAWPFTPPLVELALDEYGMLGVEGGMFFSRHGHRRVIPMSSRVARVRKGLDAAVQRSGVSLLWSHPGDFAGNPTPMLAGFEEICQRAAKLREMGKLEIVPLRGLA
ncbi:MAG: hypothetical protein A2Y63_03085 [Candidatus Riflebacteria bacterium RBG_13_59_9]|nr:MAG: hypothetical protein A2Y63_03085 [Candidatus Riflebacteria bacterium RBG_13_59_9]